MAKNIEKLVGLNVSFHKNYEKNQVNLFDNFFDDKDFDSSNFDECSYNEKLSMEYDSFGFYLSDHPSKFYKSLSYENDLYDIAKLNEYEANPLNENKFFKCICLVSELKERKSKNGKRFCFFSLSDETGILDTICFSEVLDSLNSELKVGSIVFVKLVLQQIRDTKKFVINSINFINIIRINFSVFISPRFN